MIWVMVSWVATNTFESKTRRCFLANTPVSSTTAFTTSKMRFGIRPSKLRAPEGEVREVKALVVQGPLQGLRRYYGPVRSCASHRDSSRRASWRDSGIYGRSSQLSRSATLLSIDGYRI